MKSFSIKVFLFVSVTAVLSLTMPPPVQGQEKGKSGPAVTDSVAVRDSIVKRWLKNLYTEGVSVKGDSVIISPETQRLLTDDQLRQIAFPKTYTWVPMTEFIKKQELKLAFWYMINIYMTGDEQNKETVVKALLVYDKLFKMDKILTSTFYTFIFADPEVGSIMNGHQKVTAPQVMDKKLNALKEILYFLEKYKPKESQDSTGQQH